jgi:hypothetical protein
MHVLLPIFLLLEKKDIKELHTTQTFPSTITRTTHFDPHLLHFFWGFFLSINFIYLSQEKSQGKQIVEYKACKTHKTLYIEL